MLEINAMARDNGCNAQFISSFTTISIPHVVRKMEVESRCLSEECHMLLPVMQTKLQPTSSANLLSSWYLGSITRRICRSLHILTQSTDIHGLPAADCDHNIEELTCGLRRIHIRSNVGIVLHALLEDAHAVVVAANGIVWVVERRRNFRVCVDEDVRLSDISAGLERRSRD